MARAIPISLLLVSLLAPLQLSASADLDHASIHRAITLFRHYMIVELS